MGGADTGDGDGGDDRAGRFAADPVVREVRPRAAIALSTAASWPASAARVDGGAASPRPRITRTPVPRERTAARKSNA